MAKKKYVLFSLVTRAKLSKESYGRKILSLFYDKYPLLAPQYANYYEPINNSVSTTEEALGYWESNPFLCRRKNTVVGSWYISEDMNRTAWINLEYNWTPKIDWFKLFK